MRQSIKRKEANAILFDEFGDRYLKYRKRLLNGECDSLPLSNEYVDLRIVVKYSADKGFYLESSRWTEIEAYIKAYDLNPNGT